MVGLGMTKLGVAKGTNMGLQAGLARILHFIGTFPFDLAGVPLGAWWGGPVSLLPLFPLLDIWLGDCLDGLHHPGGVHLGGYACPGKSPIVKIIENPTVVVSSSLPGIGGIVRVSGEHCSQLHEVEKMLETPHEFRSGHGGDITLQ